MLVRLNFLCRYVAASFQSLRLSRSVSSLIVRKAGATAASARPDRQPSTASCHRPTTNGGDPWLRKVFDKLDSDRDGHVSTDDLAGLGASSSSDFLRWRRSLDYGNFLAFYEEGDEELEGAFDVYDADGDGFISCAELQRALVGMGFTYCANEQFCKLIIQSVDANSDGKIDFTEFRQMMSTRNF
ncbi:hypothetical protein KP509_35G042800 [Ceratopteris richardii]|uniref:EF-hand domain-containing protein n=1 Tax=Ceratopteris richardii TaxID=49495 RepID=A0A8T2QHJ8_CERRI|nr:hypothetical protein KP509_35G042800 [Ceratopteris richardii]